MCDPDEERRVAVSADTGLRVLPSAVDAVASADVIVVAVKPSIVRMLLAELAGAVTSNQLVITLAAGVPLVVFEAALPGVPVVRTMPNTPAAVEQAMTAYAGGRHVDERLLESAREILASIGEVVEVPESALDAVTAVSGSGPAYVFLLAEALTDAGIDQGLPEDVAQQLVNQTLRGAGLLLHDSNRSAAELRIQVTSPNGTTAAALERFEAGGFHSLVADAVSAARKRSQELGEEAAASD